MNNITINTTKTTVTISPIGLAGAKGDSAYQVAVQNGFVGTEAQWLASLVGSGGTGTGDMTKAVYDTNNNGKVDIAEVAEKVDWTGVQNKPTIPTVPTNISAFINDSGYLSSVAWSIISGKPTFATVATSGSYADLINTPTIPAAQVNSDWNAISGIAQILNKPTIPTVPTNISAFTNDSGYITSAYHDSTKENTITAGTTAQYLRGDKTWQNFPTIPTAVSQLTNDSGFITNTYHDSTKQDTLISGTNIKTINGASVLGSGNISISASQYLNLVLGNYYYTTDTFDTNYGSPSQNYLYLTPFVPKKTMTISGLTFRTNSSVATNVQMFIYASDDTVVSGYPKTQLASTVTIATSASAGYYGGALTANITLTEGILYWVGFNAAAGINVNAINTTYQYSPVIKYLGQNSTLTRNAALAYAYNFGTVPTNVSGVSWINTGTAPTPYMLGA